MCVDHAPKATVPMMDMGCAQEAATPSGSVVRGARRKQVMPISFALMHTFPAGLEQRAHTACTLCLVRRRQGAEREGVNQLEALVF